MSLAGTSALQAIPLDEHERIMHLAIAEARTNPFYPFGAVIVRASDRALLGGVLAAETDQMFLDRRRS